MNTPFLGTADYFGYSDLLSEAEKTVLVRLRSFLREEAEPVLADYWERGETPLFLRDRLAALATILAHASTSFAWSVVPPILTQAFPANIRYSGISMAYQFGAIAGGGFAPLIATSLLAQTGSSWSVALYVVVAALVMLACTLTLPRFATHRDYADHG